MIMSFYNEAHSFLDQDFEVEHAFIFALFADTVNLACNNSAYYRLLKIKDKWEDKLIMSLHGYFEKAFDGKYALHMDMLEEAMQIGTFARKSKVKSKGVLDFLNRSITLKQKLKDVLALNIQEILEDRRIVHLQPFIDSGVVKMQLMRSQVSPDGYDFYITEIRDIFMTFYDYQIFGEIVLQLYKMLPLDQISKNVKTSESGKPFDALKVELFSFPLLSQLNPDKTVYLRENIYPAFSGFRKQMHTFRDDVIKINFKEENYKLIDSLFHENLSSLLPGLQQKMENELFFQYARNLYHNFNFKLFMGITSIAKMIDYFKDSAIVPISVAEAAKRNLDRETDISTCEVFFFVEYQPVS